MINLWRRELPRRAFITKETLATNGKLATEKQE
jgi:hypothetical protein